jgi:hypothetical protein
MNFDSILNMSISVFMVVASVLTVGFVLWRVGQALNAQDPVMAPKRLLWLQLVSLFWLLFTGALAAFGFFTQWHTMPPRLLVVLLPMIACWLWLALNPAVGRVAKAGNPAWWVETQAFRLLAEAFIFWAIIEGAMPKLMSVEGRNFDIITAVLAIPVAWFALRRVVKHTWMVLVFNILGLALLTNVVVHGILSSPTFGIIQTEPQNVAIGYFPGIWLPAVMVLTAGSLHILSIRSLRKV